MNWKQLLLIGLIAFGAYQHFHKPTRSIDYAAQSASNESGIQLNGYQIKPLEPFEISARVLASKTYFTGRESDLVPVDLALGWGPMADTTVLNQLSISQSNRWYFWRTKGDYPIPRRDIETHSANMHLIPSSKQIEDVIKQIKPGQMIKLAGDLVQVNAQDGFYWKSSLTREDTGSGACELVYVRDISVIH